MSEEATEERSGLEVLNHHKERSVMEKNAFTTPENRGTDYSLADLFDEIRNLKKEVLNLKQNRSVSNDSPRSYLGDSGSASPVVALCEPIDLNMRYNNAAQTIILHSKTAIEWQQSDIEDNPVLLGRIYSDAHYLAHANKQEKIKNHDGTFSNSYLNLFRKYFVLGALCSPAQGKELHRLLNRMFTRRDSTNDREKLSLDPVRKEFTKFIGEACFGKLVNPKIPRQTGVTTQDLNQRIEIVASKVRELFFGSFDVCEYQCQKEDGSGRIIILPAKEMLQLEIRQKFSDKEGSEIRYIRNHLVLFDKYEEQGGEDNPAHERSRPIIVAWRNKRSLKGHVLASEESECGGSHKRGNHKGRSKVFSFECVSTPETPKITPLGTPSVTSVSSGTSEAASRLSTFKRALNQFSPGFTSTSVGIAAMVDEIYDIVDDGDLGEYSLPPSAKRAKKLEATRKTAAGKHKMFHCSDDDDDDEAVSDKEQEPRREEEEDTAAQNYRDFD